MPSAPPTADRALDATAIANAAGAVLSRAVGGLWLGALLGVLAFIVEKSTGLLDTHGWLALALWALLPLYTLAGAAALGYVGALGGIRRAARAILLDSGALRRTVERGLARARTAAVSSGSDPDAGDEAAPRGWLGTRVAAIRRATARTVIDRLGTAAAPGADTSAQIDALAAELIDDLGFNATLVTVLALAATLAVAPLLLAVG